MKSRLRKLMPGFLALSMVVSTLAGPMSVMPVYASESEETAGLQEQVEPGLPDEQNGTDEDENRQTGDSENVQDSISDLEKQEESTQPAENAEDTQKKNESKAKTTAAKEKTG